MNRRSGSGRVFILVAATGMLFARAALAVSGPSCVNVNYAATVVPENAQPPWTLNGNDTVCCMDPATYGQSCDPAASRCDRIVNNELVVTKSGDLPSSDHSLFYLRPDCSLANASSVTLTAQAHFRPDVPTPGNGNDPNCPPPPDSTGPNDNQRFYGDGGILAMADGTRVGIITLNRVTDPRFGAPGTGPFDTFIGVPTLGSCGPRDAAFTFIATAPVDTSITHTYQLVLRPGIDFNVYLDGSNVATLSVPYASLPSSAAVGGLSGFVFSSDRGIGFFDSINTSVCGGSCGGPQTPVVTTRPFTIYEDCDGHASANSMCPSQPATCGEPKVLPFTLSECVSGATGTNNMSLDPDTAGTITRIEWNPNINKRDSGNANKAAQALADDKSRFDKAGCPRLSFQGATAYLPIDELDDIADHTGSSYTLYFDITDATGAVAHSSCNVAIHDSPKTDQQVAAKIAKDPGETPVALPCAVCVGTGCSCPSPAQVCSKSIADCAAKQSACAHQPAPHGPPHAPSGPCADYQTQCTNTGCSAP